METAGNDAKLVAPFPTLSARFPLDCFGVPYRVVRLQLSASRQSNHRHFLRRVLPLGGEHSRMSKTPRRIEQGLRGAFPGAMNRFVTGPHLTEALDFCQTTDFHHPKCGKERWRLVGSMAANGAKVTPLWPSCRRLTARQGCSTLVLRQAPTTSTASLLCRMRCDRDSMPRWSDTDFRWTALRC